MYSSLSRTTALQHLNVYFLFQYNSLTYLNGQLPLSQTEYKTIQCPVSPARTSAKISVISTVSTQCPFESIFTFPNHSLLLFNVNLTLPPIHCQRLLNVHFPFPNHSIRQLKCPFLFPNHNLRKLNVHLPFSESQCKITKYPSREIPF